MRIKKLKKEKQMQLINRKKLNRNREKRCKKKEKKRKRRNKRKKSKKKHFYIPGTKFDLFKMNLIRFILNYLALNEEIKKKSNQSILCWQVIEGIFEILLSTLSTEEHVRFFI